MELFGNGFLSFVYFIYCKREQAASQRLSSPSQKEVNMAATWGVSGTYFETCNCEAACPCVFLSAPSTGECTLLVGWHVDRGRFGDVKLDGLNAALAVYSPGHMLEVPWQAALYLDQRASPEQKDALLRIFSGQAGGHPAVVAQHIGEVLGVTSAPIEYRAEGKKRSLRIDGIAEAAIEAIEGPNGDVKLSGVPLTVVPGYDLVASKSSRLSYDDHGKAWDLSGKNGFQSPFSYQN